MVHRLRRPGCELVGRAFLLGLLEAGGHRGLLQGRYVARVRGQRAVVLEVRVVLRWLRQRLLRGAPAGFHCREGDLGVRAR
eukprot:14353446-Alexandrium_andersonii.AAC.1